ncbi:MAG: NERD domain-containing protein [Acidimicrobiales bacterium]|nr:NERD domain-containing protein [Acidimicrobiales bacterium]
MSDLAVVPWSRYGKKRLYVKTSDGTEVGHIDLVTGAIVATADGFADQLAAIANAHTGATATPPPAANSPTSAWAPPSADGQLPGPEPEPNEHLLDYGGDLSANVAGAAARAKRDQVNAQAPVRNLVARVLGVKTDERAWRVGAKGEEKVGKELTKLPDGWHVLHAVQVSDAGTDIDHVVIGPAGVFTLNTKRHPEGKVTVYERALYVNGIKVDYVQKSRGEARRAARLLTDACRFPVPVRSAIVFVDLADISEKGRPDDVLITTRRRLVSVLQGLHASLSADDVRAIHHEARNSRTWLPGPPTSATSS